MINLWLDDERPAPEGWIAARTGAEALRYLEAGVVQDASLDHDLGKGLTGYDVVCWMERTGKWPQGEIWVHSMNPVGRARMEQVIAGRNRS